MKVACVGGGPANLYFSILMMRRDPSHDITIYERNPAGSTYGWGVTYSARLMRKLRRSDPESAEAIEKNSLRWNNYYFGVRDHVTLKRDWGQGSGIGRAKLLDILADRARDLGVRIEYEHEITSEQELADADLIVAGDGVNSVLRQHQAEHFGAKVDVGRNYYIWLGTTKVFDAFTYSFVETEHGWIWCYGYKYSEERSTCVVECAPDTWRGLGFDDAYEADSRAMLEKLFADILDGHQIIGRPDAGNTAHWLRFRTLSNRTWHRGKLVLVGDAAHTTHYSVGAGTRLAIGDALTLAHMLHEGLPQADALAGYESERKARNRRTDTHARRSARWYEDLPRYVDLPPEMMIELLGMRRSAVLPFVPPQLYYRLQEGSYSLRSLVKRTTGRA